MAIVKIKVKEKNYLQIDKLVVEDKRLSWGATGLLTYLIGKPADWKVKIEQLRKAKSDGRDATRKILNELREYHYCHYFEIRVKGKIKETIYLIFENPIAPEVAKEEIEISENEEIYYKAINPKREKNISPNPEKPFSDKSFTENPTLLIIDNTNIVNTNNSTTTNNCSERKIEKQKNSSSYDFLDLSKYKLLNLVTKKNIQKNIKNLTEKNLLKFIIWLWNVLSKAKEKILM